MHVKSIPQSLPAWRDYYELCKPRVVALMLLTAWVGMCLATPTWVPLPLLIFALVGIACCAGSAAVLNHLLDKHIDKVMARTINRPVACGRVSTKQAGYFALLLGVSGASVLYHFVNPVTAWLTLMTLVGYAGVYTLYLKHATPQNIVIGGLAGAAPPLLGWTSVTGHFDPQALLLVLIIFIWTPPHFWALAIFRYEDYQRAKVPMLPVMYGIKYTKLHIMLYTVLLVPVSVLPTLIGMSGWLYGIGAFALSCRFLHWSIILYRAKEAKPAMQTFRFSIVYLMILFTLLLVDHYCF